jgi:aconitate hydratase
VYLCSPETAAASALAGHIADPRGLENYPEVEEPERYAFNQKWFLRPADDPSKVEIVRGPNIKPFPDFDPLPQDIRAEIVLKVGDNISTDIIMPAGNRVLPYRSNIPAISKFVFDVLDEDFSSRAGKAGNGAIIGGQNYGQGSSREHAALAPRYLGIRLKIAKSFARIHKSNLINFGIVPLEFADEADYDVVKQGDRIEIPEVRRLIESGKREIPVNIGERMITALLDVSPRHRRILLAGGSLNLIRQSQA